MSEEQHFGVIWHLSFRRMIFFSVEFSRSSLWEIRGRYSRPVILHLNNINIYSQEIFWDVYVLVAIPTAHILHGWRDTALSKI